MTTLYRAAIGMLAAIVLALGTLPARAQVYPSRPIHLIVPSSPGGSPDVLARLISVPLGEELGQPVIVETVTELSKYNRANPGKVNYASTGPGSAAHLGALLLERMTGTSMTHVPYRGNTNSDLIGGVVQLKLDPIAASLGLVKAGRVKVLAVSSPKRLALLPDVPTVAETVPDYELTGWQGGWAPAGTPPAIVQRLNVAIVKVIQAPEMQKKIQELGSEPLGSSPKEMADRIRRETAEWTAIIKQANITLD